MAETWLLNETITNTEAWSISAPFNSNNQDFEGIKIASFKGSKVTYLKNEGNSVIVYDMSAGATTGWTDSSYRTITFDAPVTDTTLLTWLQANGTKQSNKLSVDLTTLSGWANLSSGNHTIKIKAKGTGYRESELSAGIVVSKAAETVTLEAGTYKFIDNPTLLPYPQSEDYSNFNFTSNNVAYEVLGYTGSGMTYWTDKNDLDTLTTVYANGTWTNEAYKTITLSTDQQVSPEFYKWAITDGNLVKQAAGYNLTINYSAVPMSTSAAYIKINSDTVSSSNYDYVVQPGTSSTNPTLKNSVGTTLTVPYVVPNVEKVAFMGGLAIAVNGSTTKYTSPYTLTADTTISPGVYGPTADTPIDEPTI